MISASLVHVETCQLCGSSDGDEMFQEPPFRIIRCRECSLVFVTPNFHKVHHHHVQPLTDTNYGNIFSIWDRLFGTAVDVDDLSTLRYGIDTHPEPREHGRLGNLLLVPFEPYRAPAGSKFPDQAPRSEEPR